MKLVCQDRPTRENFDLEQQQIGPILSNIVNFEGQIPNS